MFHGGETFLKIRGLASQDLPSDAKQRFQGSVIMDSFSSIFNRSCACTFLVLRRTKYTGSEVLHLTHISHLLHILLPLFEYCKYRKTNNVDPDQTAL